MTISKTKILIVYFSSQVEPEVIKPHAIDEFIAQLTPDILDDTLNGRNLGTYMSVEFQLPKFSFEHSSQIDPVC